MGGCGSQKKPQQILNPNDYKLYLTTQMWKSTSHNLFDLHSQDTLMQKLELSETGQIVMIESDVISLKKNEFVANQIELLKFSILPNKKTLFKQPQIDNEENRPWIIVNGTQNLDPLVPTEKIGLHIGDVIQLGRIKIQIQDFNILDEGVAPLQTNNNQDYQEESIESISNQEKFTCRICLSGYSSLENPLISPCECDGSMKFIHLKCIQQWLKAQLKVQQSGIITQYTWKNLQCQLCQQPHKTDFFYENHQYSIINIPKPSGSYMMLNITNVEKDKERGVFVVDIKKNSQIKIGRIQHCDLKFHDISVSRQHAIIHIGEKDLQIEDCGSQFGTLILVREPQFLNIHDHKKLSFQCGRTMLNFEYKIASQNESLHDICEDLKEHDIQIQQEVSKESEINQELQVNDEDRAQFQDIQGCDIPNQHNQWDHNQQIIVNNSPEIYVEYMKHQNNNHIQIR